MCLDTITKRFDTPDPEEKIGYKIVKKAGIEYCGYFHTNGISYIKGIQYEAIKYKLESLWGHPYDSGFHVYTDAQEATRAFYNEYEGYTTKFLVKVAYSDVTCTGTQDTYEVAVANKMKIIEEIDYDHY